MKIKRNIRYACLALVFIMLGTSTFFASKSFASYVDSHQVETPGDVATPVTAYYRGRLVRTDIRGNRRVYPINNKTDQTFVFDNIAPEDVIDYYFYLSNSSITGQLNEVLMQVKLEIRVYLKRLGIIQGADPNLDDSYFIVGNEYLVGSTGEDQLDMKNSNLVVGVSNNSYMSYDEKDFTFMQTQIDSDTGKVDVKTPLNSDDYVAGNVLRVYKKEIANPDYDPNALPNPDKPTPPKKINQYYHTTGFFMDPSNVAFEKGYLLKITIPEQPADIEKYVAGRLYIEINVSLNQAVNKKGTM